MVNYNLEISDMFRKGLFAGPQIKNHDSAQFISVPAGSRIFSKGDTRDVAYLIDAGEIHIYEEDEGGEEKPVCRLKTGEIFGEMALIDEGKRSTTAISSTDSELLVISPEMLQERITGMDPIVGLLISLLIDRYRQVRGDYLDLVQDENGEQVPTLRSSIPITKLKSSVRNIIKSPEDVLYEIKIEQQLRRAVEEKQFIPYLQPILRLRDGSVCGFEALVRWQHPEKGMVPPNDFIPVAERTGIIKEIDMLMLESIAQLTPKLNEAAGDRNGKIYVGVNLSGVHFETSDMVERIADICASAGVIPEQLRLEITESAFISDPDLAESILNSFKSLGVTIALDDFGTGFSSLNYLHKFSIDTLKIDRTFVQDLHTQSRSLDIVRAIVGMAQTFRMNVVAEGIENDDELLALAGLGCEYGQGFLLQRPVPVEDALTYVREKRRKKERDLTGKDRGNIEQSC